MDQELVAELQSRGLIQAQSGADPELLAELEKRGLRDSVAAAPSDPNFEVAGRSASANVPITDATATASLGLGENYRNDSPPVDPYKALLTNEPVEGMANAIIRGAPANIGGMVGAGFADSALVGTSPVLGPVALMAAPAASIAGAGIGASAGEASRQAVVNFLATKNGTQPTSPTNVLTNVGMQAGANMAGQAIGEAASAAIPVAKKALAWQMRVGPNINTNLGEAVINDPGILSRAASPGEMRGQYSAFENANGLVSPRDARAAAGNLIFKPGQAEDIVNTVYQKISSPASATSIKPQELYEASQAARFLRDQAKYSNPLQAANLSNIKIAKDAIDSALETATADGGNSYAALRQANFESKAAQEFDSLYPRNVNGQPNVLRSLWAAQSGATLGGGIGMGIAGIPGAIVGGAIGAPIGALAVSPKAAGLAIQFAHAAAPMAKAAAVGFRMTPGSIAAYYQSPGVAAP